MSTLDKVKEVIIDKLGVEEDKIVPEASFVDDLGADSLDTVELIMQLEAEKMTTVKSVVDYIEANQ